MLILSKEFITDSGGDGKYRGSPGQRIVVAKSPNHSGPLNIYLHPNRLSFPAHGIFGGESGKKTRVILNGAVLSDDPSAMTQGYVTLEKDTDRLIVEFPSGAGIYDPRERDAAQVERDVRDGLISPEAAREVYGADISLRT
ncbi:MAG: hydantoinase B/oxoprolinase family protein, partial [Chloroflexi bacterium]|nr:hydantoinase B/oxoprolinase family protein [Chloroflexota bacterium]